MPHLGEIYFKVKPITISFLLSSLFFSHRFLVWFLEAPLDWISQLADTEEGKKWRRKKDLGTVANNSGCSISVRLRYALFQVLLSLCEIDSERVENWHAVVIVVQTHARSLRCPRMPAVLPLPPFTHCTNLHPVFFCFGLFVLQKHLSHAFSSGMALWLPQWSAREVPPRRLSGTSWVCAAIVQMKVLFSHLL